jgi:hypothetical protein
MSCTNIDIEYMYILMIFEDNFNWKFSELNVSLVSYKIKSVLHYRRKRSYTSGTRTSMQQDAEI